MNLDTKNQFFKVIRSIAHGDLHWLEYIGSRSTLLKYFLPDEENNKRLIQDLLRGTIYLIANPSIN